jgi:hypothetical protein
MAYPIVDGFSANGGRGHTGLCDDRDPVGECECSERPEVTDPLSPNVLAVVGSDTGLFAPPLALLMRVSVESRFDTYEEGSECVGDSADIVDTFEERRERLLDMIRIDSWSDIGDGPGSGGRGALGGRDGGGLKYAPSGGESIKPFGVEGKPLRAGRISRGECGMYVGGVGKASRIRGTGVRLPARA